MASENVTVGPARLFVAETGTALPGRSDIADLKDGALPGWTELGHTSAPVAVTETPQITTVTSQQAGRPLDAYIASYDTHIVTSLRETTAANVALAFRATTDGADLSSGAPKRVPTKAIAVVGPWHGADEVLIVAVRAALSAETNLTFDAENGAELPVDFVVMDSGTTEDYLILTPAGS